MNCLEYQKEMQIECSVADELKVIEKEFREKLEKPYSKNPYLNPKNKSFNRKDYYNNRKIVEERAQDMEDADLSTRFGGKTISIYFDEERYHFHNFTVLEKHRYNKAKELKQAGVTDRKYYREIDDVFRLLEEFPTHGPKYHQKDTSAMALTAFDSIADTLDTDIDREFLSGVILDGWLLHDLGHAIVHTDLRGRISHARAGRIIYNKLSEQLIEKGMATEEMARLTSKVIGKHNLPPEISSKIKDPILRIALSTGRFADKRFGLPGTFKAFEFTIENNPLRELSNAVPRAINNRIEKMTRFLKSIDCYYPELSRNIYEKSKEYELELIKRFEGIRS